MTHTCHAAGCTKAVPPRMFMCFPHWRMVPVSLQRLIWKHYRPGQEVGKQPTAEYLEVAKQAIDAVKRKEDDRDADT